MRMRHHTMTRIERSSIFLHFLCIYPMLWWAMGEKHSHGRRGIPIAYQTTLDTSLMKGLDTNIWVMNSPWYLHIWHIHARSVFLNIAGKVRLKQPCMILTPPCGLFTLCFSMLLYGSIANNFAALISLSFDIQASRVSTPNIWINSESI